MSETLTITGEPSKLFEELAKAQAEFVAVAKTATGQIGKERKFKYADYTTLMRCVRPALVKHGIALMQPLHTDGESKPISTTILAGHGATMIASMAFDGDLSNPQEFGRHHTYYRRYQLQALLGLAGDDDADDPPLTGEGTQESPVKVAESKPAPKARSASAESKPAAAKTPEPETSAAPSEASPSPAEEKPAPAAADTRSLNEKLVDAMKQKDWKMSDMRDFYKKHVDKKGFEKPDQLTVEQKQVLLQNLYQIAGVIPF